MHKDILLNAATIAVDYPAEGHTINACIECLPWSAEVVLDHPDGGVWVREWHAVGCYVVGIHGLCHDDLPPGHICGTCGTYSTEED